MKRVLTAYRLYLGLRLRSVARLFGALPVVAKVLFAAIAVAVGYGLHRSELPHEASVVGWAVGVFVAVGTGVCRMGRTELALLDEPFNGLDFRSSAFVTALLTEYRRRGQTVFVASHDLDHLLSYADTLSWLRCGTMTYYPDRTAFEDVRQAIRREAAERVQGADLL